jgi:hypothetical protein
MSNAEKRKKQLEKSVGKPKPIYSEEFKDYKKTKYRTAKPLPKTATAVFKGSSRKALARKVLGRLGFVGKAAVGLSIGYDIIKGIKPQKKGVTCSQGHRTIKDGGQTFCISNAKIKKAKRATPDIKSKR